MSPSGVGRWLVFGAALLLARIAGAAQDPPPCRAYLVPCNIGQHYSGTFHQISTLESPGGKTTEDVTVRVLQGKARCEGSVVSTDPSAKTGTIRGDGLFIVEWGVGVEDDPALPWYRIAAECPDLDGKPPEMRGAGIDTYRQPRRKGFTLLEGSNREESPEADPVNGVTGTVSLEWSLSLQLEAPSAPAR